MKLKATFSLSYRDDGISIRFNDESSRFEFVDALITHAEFARALGSLQYRPLIECEVRGLNNLGKKRVTEQRRILCPEKTYDKEKLSAWLMENAKEEGWVVNPYLGSQGSVNYFSEDGVELFYSVSKYVEETS